MSNQILYLGPDGSGLGFQLSGIDVGVANTADEAIAAIRQARRQNSHQLIFVDEGVVAKRLEDIEADPPTALPAVVLLPNPANPQHLASTRLQELMVKAVGSDIFSS